MSGAPDGTSFPWVSSLPFLSWGSERAWAGVGLSWVTPVPGRTREAGVAVGVRTWGSREAFGAWQAVQAADALDARKTWGAWNPRPAEVSFVAGPSCPPWLSLGPLQACQSWKACLPFGSGRALDAGHACYPGKADFAHCSFLPEEALQPWGSGHALLPLQPRPSWQIDGVSDVTEVTGGADLAIQARSPRSSLVAPTSCEPGKTDDAGGAGHAGESW